MYVKRYEHNKNIIKTCAQKLITHLKKKNSFIGKHVSTFLPRVAYGLDKMQTVTRKLEPNTKRDGIVYTPACHAGFVTDNH